MKWVTLLSFLVLLYQYNAGSSITSSKDTEIDLDVFRAAIDASGIILPESPIVLRVPAIPRCSKHYKYDSFTGYCQKFKKDKDIEPLCKPCLSPDQVLKGSTCYGRKYSTKIASCNSKGNPKKNKEFVINEDKLCIRTEVYVPKSYCLPGFKKKFIRNERVCIMKDAFLPDMTCQTVVEEEMSFKSKSTYDKKQQKCVEYVYTNLVAVPNFDYTLSSNPSANSSSPYSFIPSTATLIKKFSCPPGYTLRSRTLAADGSPAVEVNIPFDIDFTSSNMIPEAKINEFSCVASILSSVTPRPVCPNKAKLDPKSGLCRRKLATQRLISPFCKPGWYYNPTGQICQMAKVFRPYIVCPKGYEDWPGGTADTACASESKEVAECSCPAGTVNKPAHNDYPKSATKRKSKKCAHVDQELPFFTCLHVPGYTITPDRMCELQIIPSQIRNKRLREKYRYFEYKIRRSERRSRMRAAIGDKLNSKYTRISIPEEALIQPVIPDYGPVLPCLWIANNDTLELPKNADGIPVACIDEQALLKKRDAQFLKEDQQWNIRNTLNANLLVSPTWTTPNDSREREEVADDVADDVATDDKTVKSFVTSEVGGGSGVLPLDENFDIEQVDAQVEFVAQQLELVQQSRQATSLPMKNEAGVTHIWMPAVASPAKSSNSTTDSAPGEWTSIDVSQMTDAEIASLLNVARSSLNLSSSSDEVSSSAFLFPHGEGEAMKTIASVDGKVLLSLSLGGGGVARNLPLLVLEEDEDENAVEEFAVDMNDELELKELANIQQRQNQPDALSEIASKVASPVVPKLSEEKEIDKDDSTSFYEVKQGFFMIFDDAKLENVPKDETGLQWKASPF